MTLPPARQTLLILVVVVGQCRLALAQDRPAQPPAQPPESAAQKGGNAGPHDPLKLLLDEIDRLQQQIDGLRRELAQAKIEAAQARRELDELRQFIADHHEFGTDFEQYSAIKKIAEREARRRQIEATRQQREAQQAQRVERRRAAQAERRKQDAEAQRLARYRRAGFSPVGLDVYVGKMAFYYRAKDTTEYDIEFSPFFGLYYLDRDRRTEIDYSSMTISGSTLNASGEVRNIGIAVTFFDENGNQVGGEIIQINNARPDVPYPFTATLQMALNRSFRSSSTYVLYADAVDQGEGVTPADAPTTKPTQPGNSSQSQRGNDSETEEP